MWLAGGAVLPGCDFWLGLGGCAQAVEAGWQRYRTCRAVMLNRLDGLLAAMKDHQFQSVLVTLGIAADSRESHRQPNERLGQTARQASRALPIGAANRGGMAHSSCHAVAF